MPAMDFREKVVLVTGASSGIGLAIAEEFARQGAKVAPVTRKEADVRNPAEVERVVAGTLARHGHIDVLVNCAGIGLAASAVEMNPDDLRNVIETNFFAAYNFLRLVSRHMIERRSGLIIQMSSVNGFCAVPLGSAYVASKFALEGLSRSARAELRPHNVRLLIVRPGLVDTGFFDKAKDFRARDPIPMRRMLSPEYVARQTIQAAAAGRTEIVIGAEGKLLWWLSKISPRLVDGLIARATASHHARTKAPSTDRTAAPSPQNPPAPDRAPRPAAK